MWSRRKTLAWVSLLVAIFNSTVKGENSISKISGQTNYTQQTKKTLVTTIDAEYTYYFVENYKYGLYLGGKLSVDLDHFGKTIKTNVFTVFGVDF